MKPREMRLMVTGIESTVFVLGRVEPVKIEVTATDCDTELAFKIGMRESLRVGDVLKVTVEHEQVDE